MMPRESIASLFQSMPPGWSCHTRAPGDGRTYYAFFRDAPANQSYFGPDNARYIARGYDAAANFIAGLRMGYDTGVRVGCVGEA